MEKLTRFERTRLISARALQLAFGAPCLVKAKDNATAFDLAKQELEEKVIPLAIIRRRIDGSKQKIFIS